jgi:dATP/dGTP diphosphohydrolase, N-terminal
MTGGIGTGPQVEIDPTGRSSNTPGAKMDFGKAPVFRGLVDYFPQAISAVSEVSQKGAEKYTWKGWETVPEGFERYSDAMMRHLCAESHEDIDQDTGCLHAAQVAWNALARLQLLINAEGEEDASITAQESK